MKAIYKQVLVPGLIWGLPAGLTIICLFYLKRTYQFNSLILVSKNISIVIFQLIISTYFYRKKLGKIRFSVAREFSFSVYISIITVLLFFKFHEGYFLKFSKGGVIFGCILLMVIGRGISYIIGTNMYNTQNKT